MTCLAAYVALRLFLTWRRKKAHVRLDAAMDVVDLLRVDARLDNQFVAFRHDAAFGMDRHLLHLAGERRADLDTLRSIVRGDGLLLQLAQARIVSLRSFMMSQSASESTCNICSRICAVWACVALHRCRGYTMLRHKSGKLETDTWPSTTLRNATALNAISSRVMPNILQIRATRLRCRAYAKAFSTAVNAARSEYAFKLSVD